MEEKQKIEAPKWNSEVHEHYHLTVVCMDDPERMEELELLKVKDPAPWAVVDSWFITLPKDVEPTQDEADGVLLAVFKEYEDAVVWAYRKLAELFGPIMLCSGAGIPNETLRQLGWEGGIVHPQSSDSPLINREWVENFCKTEKERLDGELQKFAGSVTAYQPLPEKLDIEGIVGQNKMLARLQRALNPPKGE